MVDLLTLPITLIYSGIFLSYLMGLSFLGGIAVFLVGAGVNSILSRCIQKGSKKKQKLVGERLNYT